MTRLSPILKWAGGKRQLLPQIMPLIPPRYERYFEPFVGAGAVLLELQPSQAVINDTNQELINVYEVIKTQPDELIDILREHERKHCDSYYYAIRDMDRDTKAFNSQSKVEKAARTIYLNRTCYNGLYRVNKAGFFNTPIGRNTSIQIVNEKGIKGIHDYLSISDVILMNTDYKNALKGVRENDFVFLDPPYYPTKKDYFLRYDSCHFDIQEQEELKTVCDELTDMGVKFIETNSDCSAIRELYSSYRLITVDVRRSINAKVDGRKGTEIIICNY